MNFKKEILVPSRKIFVSFRPTKDCHSFFYEYEFQKRNNSSIQENIFFIQTYQGLSFLPVTSTGEQIFSLNWDFDMDSFVGMLCI